MFIARLYINIYRDRSSLRPVEDVAQFCKNHNLKITLHHSVLDSNLLSLGTSAAPILGQNKQSLSRYQLSDNSSSKVTEEQNFLQWILWIYLHQMISTWYMTPNNSTQRGRKDLCSIQKMDHILY